MKKIIKIQEWIAKISLAVSAVMLATVAGSILLSVADRFLFKVGMMWTEQYARYMLIWSTFLSARADLQKRTDACGFP